MLHVENLSPYPKKRMRDATKQMLWRMLLKDGASAHSGLAATLPYLLNRLEQEGRAYRLEAHPGHGYGLTLIPHARDVR